MASTVYNTDDIVRINLIVTCLACKVLESVGSVGKLLEHTRRAITWCVSRASHLRYIQYLPRENVMVDVHFLKNCGPNGGLTLAWHNFFTWQVLYIVLMTS